MSRTSAREHAFRILFQLQFVKDDAETSVRQYLDSFTDEETDEKDLDFILQEVKGVKEQEPLLDQTISKALKGWSLYRLSKVDLSILRVAVYEILFDPEIPETVSINEAINLAKKYSQDAAPGFINGVLAGVVSPASEEAEETEPESADGNDGP